jgi:hypothetical protein
VERSSCWSFSIYAWLGVVGFEFDGAVDVVIIEGFIEVPAIAENTEGGVPAVDIPLLGVIGVREKVHGGAADAVLSGALGARVCTYEVTRLSKHIAVLRAACVNGSLRGDTEKARVSVYSGRIKRRGAYANAFGLAKGEGYVGAGEQLVMGVEFAVVGNGAMPGGSAWCGWEEVTCCWVIL